MIDQIVKSLTLEEKAVLLSGKTVWETFEIKNKNIPSIFLADGPHGLRKQEGASDHLGLNQSIPATCFPTAATLANSWDELLVEKVGKALGKEAKANNVQVLLGPGLNIKRNPLCGRNFEYFSEDPYLSGKMAASIVRGIQENGTIACPKHLAVNNQELRRMSSDSIVDEQTLREIYLTGFEIVVKESKPKAIMSAYNKINGIYANEHKELLQDILRDDWGFEGFVVSDWGGDNNHVEGVKNGSHLQMPSTGLYGPLEIIEAVENKTLSVEALNNRVQELLTVLLNIPEENNQMNLDFEEQHKIAYEAALKSAVLLKNNQLLPINDEVKVAIIGDFAQNPRFQGAGSSVVNAKNVEITNEVIKKYPLNVIGYEQGFNRHGKEDKSLSDNAINLAKNSDVVLLYIGLDEISESEGKDRERFNLSKNQVNLIDKLSELDVSIVAVVSAGSAIDFSWENKVDAILHGYLTGEAGATALLDIIVGKTSPSGKLNETIPLKYSDIPFGDEFPQKDEKVLYKEGIFVGYRYFDKANTEVQYPFGYGLSYTTFEYSELIITQEGVKFKISNVGNMSGEEIPQLYIGNPTEKILRPEKELKGFSKVFLNPGENKQVFIPFDETSFRYFNSRTHNWEIDTQDYLIYVGSSSRDIRLEGTIRISGNANKAYNLEQLPNYQQANLLNLSEKEFEILHGKSLPNNSTSGRKLLNENSTIQDMYEARSVIARFIQKRIQNMIAKNEANGKTDLNLLFINNMPFRAIAKMTNGMVSMQMVDGIVTMVNGRHIKGFGNLLSSFSKGVIKKQKLKKKIRGM